MAAVDELCSAASSPDEVDILRDTEISLNDLIGVIGVKFGQLLIDHRENFLREQAKHLVIF